eukprot:1394231-Pyramimonas_sp.AAC.2
MQTRSRPAGDRSDGDFERSTREKTANARGSQMKSDVGVQTSLRRGDANARGDRCSGGAPLGSFE